jgi:hypothetical protein
VSIRIVIILSRKLKIPMTSIDFTVIFISPGKKINNLINSIEKMKINYQVLMHKMRTVSKMRILLTFRKIHNSFKIIITYNKNGIKINRIWEAFTLLSKEIIL